MSVSLLCVCLHCTVSSTYTSVHNLATHMCHLPYNCHLHSQWARLRHTKVACHIHVSLVPALTATRRSGIFILFYFTPLFARFLLSSAGICLATLCFSISSRRDDVARVAGLLLHGRCKVVVRVCVVSLSCCFMSSVVSSLWLLFVR